MVRKWYVPLTVLGLGGLGVLLLSERGRAGVRWLCDKLHHAPENLLGWNESAQLELDRIQAALSRVADSVETAR